MHLRNALVMIMLICMGRGLAYAQFANDGNGRRHDKMEVQVQKIYDQLGLSDAQKTEIEDNKNKHKAIREELTNKLKGIMQSMGEELKKKDLDLNKINALHAQFKDLRNQLADERFNAILEVRKILTPDQFAQFVDLLDKDRAKGKATPSTP